MRNLLLALALAAAPACTDGETLDDAGEAAADGDSRGSQHADNIDDDFAGDSNELVAEKSAAIMIAIDENSVLLADYLIATSIDPLVLDYAELELDEHLDSLAILESILFDYDLLPFESSISDALRSETDGVLRNLQIAADLDYEYLRSQVVLHAEAFVIVDELALRSPFIDFTHFYEDTLIITDDHQIEAELLLRAL